jgi:phage tail sheath protein FI
MPGPPQSPNVFVEEFSLRQGEIEQVSTSVTCFIGPETMTADDIAQGRLNIVVGFAPHMPAEFVVVRARQQTATP